MKFGKTLKENVYKDWVFYYLDYDGLKRFLKERGSFSDQDEENFVEFLEKELDKVSNFHNVKLGELTRHVSHCENMTNAIPRDAPADEYLTAEQEISNVIADITELARYSRLNYSGFLKIVKKHDKHCGYNIKPMFMLRLNSKNIYKEDEDPLLLRVSQLYDKVRACGKSSSSSAQVQGTTGSQAFVRKTTKYWVHPDNVTELKYIILKHLPVLVFKGKDSDAINDPAISSVYFDNDNFDLYKGRIEKRENAQAIRLRWYGGFNNTEIFVERKLHKEDWTGEPSVKARFPIKEKNVNAFLSGEYDMKKLADKMRVRKLKPEADIEALEVLSEEVQETILSMKLKPMVRSFYNRTAFQLPGDARVRISLDTQLSMIREDNFDFPRSGSNWRRTDVKCDFPFSYLPQKDITRFPYAILEVKLQTQLGAEPPKWIQDLISSHLVEEVPKFSKYIHGVATLLESRVNLLPFWLPQMDTDIKKPKKESWPTLDPRASTLNLDDRLMSIGERVIKKTAADDDSIVIDIPHSESKKFKRGLKNEDKDSDDEHDESSPLLGSRSSQSSITKKKGILGRFLKRSSGPHEYVDGAGRKRIAIPVRVEPKVFFANERTFLSWLNFSAMLGGLALSLLNFGDNIGKICGLLFTIDALAIMVYALLRYQWRAQKIREKSPGPYDDRIGPIAIVVSLLIVSAVNFWLRFGH